MTLHRLSLATWTPWLVRTTGVLFVLLAAWNFARIGWPDFPAQPHAVRTATPPLINYAPPTRTNDVSVERIIQADLFGRSIPIQRMHSPPPETHLALVLLGTYTQTNGRGYAIIAPAMGAPAKVYAVGDTLPDRARLSRVDAQRVLLATARGQELLKLNQSHTATPLFKPAPLPGQGGAATPPDPISTDHHRPARPWTTEPMAHP